MFLSEVTPFENERCLLMPYVDGVTTVLPEEFLPAVYRELKQHRLLDITFPGVGNLTLAKFVAYFADRHGIVAGMVRTEDGKCEVAGVGWIYELHGEPGCRKANVGFVFFPKFWGDSRIREIAKMALRFWMVDLKVDVLFGTALKRNALAQKFDRALGFKKVADLPLFFPRNGKLEDAVLVMRTRQEFMADEGIACE